MNSDSLNIAVGKAFIRLLTLGVVWSVFFVLYKISGHYDPGLVGVIVFFLGIYAFLEVFSIILDEIIRRKQKNQNGTVHDRLQNKHNKDEKDMSSV